jgi:hypothetical protein
LIIFPFLVGSTAFLCQKNSRPSGIFNRQVAAILGAWAHYCYQEHLDEAAFGANDRPGFFGPTGYWMKDGEIPEVGWIMALPSGKHTKSYGQWPFIVSFPIKHGDYHPFNSDLSI